MTKAVSEYPDGKSQPHVKVVKDMMKLGFKETNYINHFIPYIICKGDAVSSIPVPIVILVDILR